MLLTLLIRGVTLPGAADGMLFFITPQWDKILQPEVINCFFYSHFKLNLKNINFKLKVWYAAVTQCFFSLSVGFGPIIMNASYNGFRHRIYRYQFKEISIRWKLKLKNYNFFH